MDSESLYKYITPETSGIPLAPRIRTQEEITPDSIRMAMNMWMKYESRFRQLYLAYIGVRPVVYLDADEVQNSKDEATIANFCRYIVEILKGYIIGNPPEYSCAEDDQFGKAIVDMFQKQNMQIVDGDTIQDMITFGRAFQLVYLDAKGVPKTTVVSPRDAFVAYSGDVEQDSIFGCVRYAEDHDDGSITYRLYLYTKNTIQVWTGETSDGPWVMEEERMHPFGRVPLIEFCNNKEFMGDFEPIIALQNLYNRTIKNRVADIDAFVKSALVITGAVVGMTAKEVEEKMESFKKNRVLQFDNDGSGASYLEKSMDESGVQVLQDQIKNDIHKFSMVPDMSDEQFANNASGIAMEYKMFATNQMVSNKALQFQKGFMRRCKLYDAALNNPTGDPDAEASADIGAMKIVFRINTPQDLGYIVNPLIMMVQSGLMSKDSARKSIALIKDPKGEEKKVQADADAQAKLNRQSFEDDYSKPNATEDDEEDDI